MDSDNTETPEFETKAYGYYEQLVTRKITHFYISGVIGDPIEYIDMIHKVSNALADETIILHINTVGGNLATGVQIINAMKYSQAHIACSLEGEAHSLGSLIFLAADEFLTHDNAIMMIHNYSGGVFGKGNEQVSELEATVKWFNQLAADIYIPFLSESELANILKGEDKWLLGDEIRKRLNKMIKTIQKEMKDAEKLATQKQIPTKKGSPA